MHYIIAASDTIMSSAYHVTRLADSRLELGHITNADAKTASCL